MNATIDRDGVLIIQAETELEVFALDAWWDEQKFSEPLANADLIINRNIEESERE